MLLINRNILIKISSLCLQNNKKLFQKMVTPYLYNKKKEKLAEVYKNGNLLNSFGDKL